MNRRGFLSRIILAAGAMLLELRAAAGEGDRSEAYSVVLVGVDGRTSVYQQYPAR